MSTESQAGGARFGVRLPRGIVTYFNGQPIVTYEQADEARQTVGKMLGEWGEIEKVFDLPWPGLPE